MPTKFREMVLSLWIDTWCGKVSALVSSAGRNFFEFPAAKDCNFSHFLPMCIYNFLHFLEVGWSPFPPFLSVLHLRLGTFNLSSSARRALQPAVLLFENIEELRTAHHLGRPTSHDAKQELISVFVAEVWPIPLLSHLPTSPREVSADLRWE